MKEVKNRLKVEHGIDLDVVREDFGPSEPNWVVKEGAVKAKSGRDFHFRESDLLRICVARHFNIDAIVPALLLHL